MPSDFNRAQNLIAQLLNGQSPAALTRRLEPFWENPAVRVPSGAHITADLVERRWKRLPLPPESRDVLLGQEDAKTMAAFQQNIENFIGFTKTPLGLAGPLRVNGLFCPGGLLPASCHH